jgi:hypothetical protein
MSYTSHGGHVICTACGQENEKPAKAKVKAGYEVCREYGLVLKLTRIEEFEHEQAARGYAVE